jgi:putative FmdB family regulatory protein
MPIYEFRCLACNELFEALVMGSGDDETEILCPHCKQANFERVISRTSHQVRSGRGNGPRVENHNCPSGSCSTVTLPGPD